MCIFCDIIEKKVPAEIVYENEHVMAFLNIAPKTPIHILIVPKMHITSINTLTVENSAYASALLLAAPLVARTAGVGDGYKLACNVERKGGQMIDHLHLHLLGWREHEKGYDEDKFEKEVCTV